MAFYIEIKKISEDNFYASYEYSSTENKVGKITIDKKTGDVYFDQLAEDDVTAAKANRAATKLMKHWQKGEYPDKTYWAS